MDEARITITVKPKHIERILYWVVIVILTLLLILCYLNDTGTSSPDETDEDSVTGDATAPLPDETPTEPLPSPEPDETCSDDIKNQDETDVDCGGSCGGCAAGKSCDTASDCAGDYCTDGECTNSAPLELSGDLDISLTDVELEQSQTTDNVKVISVDFTVENGLDEDFDFLTFKLFAKSKSNADYCLNQAPAEEFECPTPYATNILAGPESGETLQQTWTVDGVLVQDYSGATQYYDPGDDQFNLWLYVYDESGNQIDGKTISTFMSVG